MFSHNKRDNLPIVNYCSFILTGIFSILYCAEKICEGEFIFIDFSDYGLFVLIFLMSIFIIFIGALQLRTALRHLGREIESNDQKPIAHKLIELFWYPDEYYDRKNNHTLFNKIKRYIGFLIIFISVYLFMVITFFASNRLSLLEIIIRIVAMLYILMCCRKYLM